MRADAGNSSSVAFALTGATPAVPVPIWIRITAPGVGNVYYDGLGVTAAMTGVTIVDSVNIVLTGAGAGMAITPGVGSQVAGNTWRATCSSLADQSGNGRNYVQLTPAQQPIVTAGLNGKPGLLFDGLDDYLTSDTGALLNGPYLVLVVGRVWDRAPGANCIVGGSGYSGTVYEPLHSQFMQYNDLSGNAVAFSDLTNQRWAAVFHNGTGDSLRIGSLPISTGVSAGPSNGSTRFIGATGTGGQAGKIEIFATIYCPIQPYSAFDTALNTPPGYGPGAIAV